MYSGEDSSGEALSRNQFSQWQSQSACTIPSDQVDWAALAQQWIQMKETNPQPNNYESLKLNGDNLEEKGEAPMEVVKDDEPVGGPLGLSTTFVGQNWQSPWFNNQQFPGSTWNSWPNVDATMIQIPTVQAQNFFRDATASNSILKPTEIGPTTETPTMDAAKRKALPAWLREGLEKMEKEKQKQLERTKKISTGSDPETGNDVTLEEKRITVESILKSKSDEEESCDEEPEKPDVSANITLVEKTHEEIVEELMFVVRRSLTELLLEVTNEEIQSIAQETLRKYKTKASSAQVFRKSAISSLTGKLGLGAYADSASENSESDDTESEDNNDSEEEIKENIRIRQNAFKQIALDIETAISRSEEKRQRSPDMDRLKKETSGSPQKTYDKDSGETQPDKVNNMNGKRIKERSTRFSSSKDSKPKSNAYIIQATAMPSSSSYDYDNKKSSNTARKASYTSDSSSDSHDSHKYSRHRHSKEKNYKKSSSRKGSGHSGHLSSDSDEQYRRRHYKSRSKDRSRSRSRSRSHTSSRRTEKRY